MNDLYGSKFIEKQRSSGYKSTIYAMAEIVDNSVDAKASRIDLVLKEKENFVGTRTSIQIDEVYFMDNGSGMTLDRINSCLTFSEGEGRTDSRIGAFGVGLPNASISVGRRVEVYSKDSNNNWNYVFLDLDDQEKRDKPGYDSAFKREPQFDRLVKIGSDVRTIIRWSKLDQLDAAKAKTIIERAEKLLGRIYRYKLEEGMDITYCSFLEGNSDYTIKPTKIIPYDPLFVMQKKNYITDKIWYWANHSDKSGRHTELGDQEEFTSQYHYKKFIKGCKENETNLPLFQKYDDYWNVEYEVPLGNRVYKWRIKASFAYKSIANPGIRSGGGTKLGKEFGYKMSGTKNFKSANIFFLRANREIDFGNFGLYTVTDEKNRFWTIEIHFDSDLDELMGVSNNKQSVDFNCIQNSDLENLENFENLPLGFQREILWAQMTETVVRCIREMRKFLSGYANEFRDLVNSKLAEEEEEGSPIPQPETAVIEVIPKGGNWTEEQKEEISSFLKEKYMHLSQDIINQQVDVFAKGLTKTLVLYSPNETGNLFELKEKKGKFITLINTNHIYYRNIIEPLKHNRHLKVFAIAIEMLISSCALEMERLNTDNEEKYKPALDNYLLQISSRLNEFITDSHIKVVPEEFEKQLKEELEEVLD